MLRTDAWWLDLVSFFYADECAEESIRRTSIGTNTRTDKYLKSDIRQFFYKREGIFYCLPGFD